MRAEGGDAGALDDRVDVPFHLIEPWAAFWALHNARSSGLTPNPIPWSEIAAWCDITGIDHDERASFATIVRCLDAEFLGWYAENAAAKRSRK